jgi:hypothetical protein
MPKKINEKKTSCCMWLGHETHFSEKAEFPKKLKKTERTAV